MNLIDWLLRLGRPKFELAAKQYLHELADANATAHRRDTTAFLRNLASHKPTVDLGTTPWGQKVLLPLDDLTEAFGLVEGATGSGKSRVGLLLIEAILEALINQSNKIYGCGVLDAKGDLFQGALFLIAQLEKTNPQAAEELRRRLVIIDIASTDPITLYDLLKPWPDTELESFAAARTDLVMDLLEDDDKPSLAGRELSEKANQLLSCCGESIIRMPEVLTDESARMKLISRCRDPRLATYFVQQFPHVPKATIGAIVRRMSALFRSEGVRLALAGGSAPDFRQLQDDGGRLILINCFGRTVPRSVRRFMQRLIFLDIAAAIFARQHPERRFLWLLDEAQHFFNSEQLREATAEIACMSRTFGTFFIWFTQNFSAAVHDARMVKFLHTNLHWFLGMRGDPADFAFMKAALPVTGRRCRPQENPFAERSFYSEAEERGILFEEIAKLPQQAAWLWLKSWEAQAIRIKTRDIEIPVGQELERATAAIRNDPSIGMRVSREQYDKLIAERKRDMNEEPAELGTMLKRAYQGMRGEVRP